MRWTVSIAKAIPSLLEPPFLLAFLSIANWFQSRKRFRHCWSLFAVHFNSNGDGFNRESDSVTVGAYALRASSALVNVSIAKEIPSLLERRINITVFGRCSRFNRESDSVTVGASSDVG